MNLKVNLIFLLFTVMLIDCLAQQKEEQISYGKYETIYSNILGEERTLFVYLPDDYERSEKCYPVIFQLDGSKSLYLRGIAAVERLNGENKIPEVIYIAVDNTDRSRDMLPFKTVYHRTAGKADNFLKFLSEELIPFVNNKYRTASFNSIIGFSNSGQFVLYTLLTKPDSFDAYIACSPSIAFNPDYYNNKLLEFLNKNESLEKTLSIVYGSAEGKAYYGDQHYFDMQNCVIDFVDILKQGTPRGFNWSLNIVEGGKHVPFGCIYEGIKAVFRGWKPLKPPEITPSGGFFNTGEHLNVTIKAERGDIHYTIDGSEPVKESEKYSGSIKVHEPVKVKAKVYGRYFGESETANAVFKTEGVFKKINPGNNLEKGLKFNYYKDYFFGSRLPDFENTNPAESGITRKVDLSVKKRHEGFALTFEGCIDIPGNSNYTFFLRSNDESMLFIDDRVLIHKEQSYGLPEKSGIVPLEKGWHKIRVLYVGTPFRKKLELSLFMEGPGIRKKELPAGMLYHME